MFEPLASTSAQQPSSEGKPQEPVVRPKLPAIFWVGTGLVGLGLALYVWRIHRYNKGLPPNKTVEALVSMSVPLAARLV